MLRLLWAIPQMTGWIMSSIFGIGHDIVENWRMVQLLEKFEDKIINKVLTVSEQLVYQKRLEKAQFVAKRFAAKEAFAKACGTGLRQPIVMPNISVVNNDLGQPSFVFADNIIHWLEERHIGKCHLSLSDEKMHSSAFVVLEYA